MAHENVTLLPCYRVREADWYGFAVRGVVPLFLLLFGAGGMLYSKRNLKNQKSMLVQYLLALYKWDLLFLISNFGFYGFSSIFTTPLGAKQMNGIYVYFYLIFYPMINFSMTGSMWSIVVISVERYIALSQPLRHHSRDRNRLCLIVRASVLVGSLVLNLPRVFELTTMACWDGAGIKPQIAPSLLRLNSNFQLIYKVVCNGIFVCPLPFILTTVVTAKTWLIRRVALRAQNRIGGDKTTLMLLAMVGKFLLCETCPTILNGLEWGLGPATRNAAWFSYFIDISNVLVVFNSATNWMIFASIPQTGARRADKQSLNKATVTLNDEQLRALQNVWPREKHEELGIELLRASMTANPFYKQKLADIYCLEVFDESAHATHVSHHGQNIGYLLDRLFSLALAGQNFDKASYEIAQAARAHAKHAVVLRNADWIVVKKYLLEKFFETLSEGEKQLGNRLVSTVVSQLKNGFAYVPSIPAKVTVVVNFGNGTTIDSDLTAIVAPATSSTLAIDGHSKRSFTKSPNKDEFSLLENGRCLRKSNSSAGQVQKIDSYDTFFGRKSVRLVDERNANRALIYNFTEKLI